MGVSPAAGYRMDWREGAWRRGDQSGGDVTVWVGDDGCLDSGSGSSGSRWVNSRATEEVALTGLSDLQEKGRVRVSRTPLEFLVCKARWVGCHVLSCGAR